MVSFEEIEELGEGHIGYGVDTPKPEWVVGVTEEPVFFNHSSFDVCFPAKDDGVLVDWGHIGRC